MSYAIVTVIHDSREDLVRLLASVERHLPARPPVVVVDTGSQDGGAQLARDWGADVVELGAGTGFGAANNAGLERVDAPVTVLLNPDVVLLDDGLPRLAGIAAGRDVLAVPRLLNPDGTVQRSAHPAPGTPPELVAAAVHPRLLPGPARLAADPWRADAPRRVGWAIAAALAGRTDTLRALGPFDPDPFLFFEDMDLCLRAAARGVPTELRPEVALLHRGGHSTSEHFGGEPHEEIARRRRAVVRAHGGERALARDDAAQALTFATRAAARAALRRDFRRPLEQLRALRRAKRAG